MDKATNLPVNTDRLTPQWGWAVYLLILVVTLASFWQCLSLPFVQDDWALLGACQTSDFFSLVRRFFDFGSMLMFRPAGLTYLTLLFKAFGETAWPAHVLALSIHALNAAIVYRIMLGLTLDQMVAAICALIYAAAVAVHLDTLCWGVGIFDLGGAFFFFSSIALFLSEKPYLSVSSFIVGLLFKESTVVLPVVLVVIHMSRLDHWGVKDIRFLARRLLPYFVVLIPLLAGRMLSDISPLKLPTSHPYFVDPFGVHVLSNLYRYGAWMLQALLPYGGIDTSLYHILLQGLLILSVIIAVRWSKSKRLLAGLSLWILFALLPVLFMPNHNYRYYATYALPPFICAILLVAKDLLNHLGIKQHRNTIIAGLGTLSVLFSVGQSNRVFGEGFDQKTLLDGTNGLIRRAHYVEEVRQQMLRQMPTTVEGATMLIGGVDLWSFNKEKGPQVWYKEPGLTVYDLNDLRIDNLGLYIEKTESQGEVHSGPLHERISLNADTVHAFIFAGHSLHPIGPDELAEIAKAHQS